MNIIVCQRYGFFSVLAAIIREGSDKQLVLRVVRLCRSFIYLIEWHQRRVKCKQLIGYINTREKITYVFTLCCHGFSQGRKSLYNTAVYVIIIFTNHLHLPQSYIQALISIYKTDYMSLTIQALTSVCINSSY